MAKEQRRSGSAFTWFLAGLLTGAALVIGGYLYLDHRRSSVEVPAAEPATPLPDLGGAPPPTAGTPASAPPPALPSQPAPSPAPPAADGTSTPSRPPTPQEPDPSVEDDAAAVGMTGRPVNPDPASP